MPYKILRSFNSNPETISCALSDEFLLKEYPHMHACIDLDPNIKFKESAPFYHDDFIEIKLCIGECEVQPSVLAILDFPIHPTTFSLIAKRFNRYSGHFYVIIDWLLEKDFPLECSFRCSEGRFKFSLWHKHLNCYSQGELNMFYFGNRDGLYFDWPAINFLDL